MQELFDILRHGTDVLTASLMLERAYELGYAAAKRTAEALDATDQQ